MAALPSFLTDTRTVLVGKPDTLARKLACMQDAGSNTLHVIADFDYTLTHFALPDGSRAMSTHRVIEASPILGSEFQVKSKELFKLYYPIEVSDMPKEEKYRHMVDWWTQAHDAILAHNLYRHDLDEMVKSPEIRIRDRASDLFELAETYDVPFHIFSAGLYDVIHAFLIERGLCKYHVHVVSNMMVFDESGKAVAFQGEVIHSLNKSAEVLKASPHYSLIENRRNVLLLGDNLTDIHMSDGLEIDTQISVGFLSDRVEERKKEFLETFDIVILGDLDLSTVVQLLKTILEKSTPVPKVVDNTAQCCD